MLIHGRSCRREREKRVSREKLVLSRFASFCLNLLKHERFVPSARRAAMDKEAERSTDFIEEADPDEAVRPDSSPPPRRSGGV